jgi:hypothetical protein
LVTLVAKCPLPEERELLLQRMRAAGHALQPSSLQLQHVLPLLALGLLQQFLALLGRGVLGRAQLLGAVRIRLGPLRLQS